MDDLFWTPVVVVRVSGISHAIDSVTSAEMFLLSHWSLFEAADLNASVMACLLSSRLNVQTSLFARNIFTQAANSAGILIQADNVNTVIIPPISMKSRYISVTG